MLFLYMVSDVGLKYHYSSIEKLCCEGNLARTERWLPGDVFTTSGYRSVA
ncbi:hypothetical protein RchiOBHm_Chr6g0264801 [Rosa chinensis]|uniref:Uncharacterized protein n=1 Tax=Rosa chinensis TaxID=74649 RepID=A0A2P6PP96_ROSCH|nr:hypothetical protein RchiOBHm_Chr6g0264801 [Rosa chinensis]